jgi:four helix bundle suffix protein
MTHGTYEKKRPFSFAFCLNLLFSHSKVRSRVLSVPSVLLFGAAMSQGFIPPHGGYENLLTFRKARIVYDATVCFCDRFVDKRDRTRDQMIQAARSGKQNIIEASQASGTSKESEIKLTNVARASLEELLEDYRDFLRVRGHEQWDKNNEKALYVRRLGARKDGTYETYRTHVETKSPDVVANILICLIHQTNFLLDRQIRQLERAFLAEGGLRERMTHARLAERDKQRGRPPA